MANSVPMSRSNLSLVVVLADLIKAGGPYLQPVLGSAQNGHTSATMPKATSVSWVKWVAVSVLNSRQGFK